MIGEMTQEEFEFIREKIFLRTRLHNMSDVIDPITDDEIKEAIFDSLDDLNSFPPQSNFSIEKILESNDTRWKRLLILGSIKNVTNLIVIEMTDKEFDSTVAEFQIDSKLGDYKELLNSLTEEYEKLIERLKRASSKKVMLSHYRTTLGNRTSAPMRRMQNFNYSRLK